MGLSEGITQALEKVRKLKGKIPNLSSEIEFTAAVCECVLLLDTVRVSGSTVCLAWWFLGNTSTSNGCDFLVMDDGQGVSMAKGVLLLLGRIKAFGSFRIGRLVASKNVSAVPIILMVP